MGLYYNILHTKLNLCCIQYRFWENSAGVWVVAKWWAQCCTFEHPSYEYTLSMTISPTKCVHLKDFIFVSEYWCEHGRAHIRLPIRVYHYCYYVWIIGRVCFRYIGKSCTVVSNCQWYSERAWSYRRIDIGGIWNKKCRTWWIWQSNSKRGIRCKVSVSSICMYL